MSGRLCPLRQNDSFPEFLVRVTDSNGSIATSPLEFDITRGVADHAQITVEVSNSTSLLYTMPVTPGTRGPSFNGYNVRVMVPEPASVGTWLTLLAGLVGAKFRGKRLACFG